MAPTSLFRVATAKQTWPAIEAPQTIAVLRPSFLIAAAIKPTYESSVFVWLPDKSVAATLAVGAALHTWPIPFVGKAATVRWKINCGHMAFLQHALVVHHTVILPAITTSSMEEEDLL